MIDSSLETASIFYLATWSQPDKLIHEANCERYRPGVRIHLFGICLRRQTMQEVVVGDGSSGMKCVTLTLTIPAWPKGGPLSAGSARPSKSRYQRL